jgi:methylmalonyl-CoA mutase
VTDQAEIEVLKVDNKSVRESQIAKLQRLKGERDPKVLAAALKALTEAAAAAAATCWRWRWRRRAPRRPSARYRRHGEGVGPASRRYARRVRRLYAEAGKMNKDVERVRRMAEEFAANDGRRPRILVAKMGQDGHDRGQKVIASAFAGPRLRRRHRPAVRHARRGGAPGRSRTTCTSSACRRWRPAT